MKKILEDKSFKKAIIISSVFLGTIFLCLLLGAVNYGYFLFMVFPITLGLSIGALPSVKWAHYGALLSLVIFLLLLIIGRLEGMICVLMALPFILFLLFVGSSISYLYRRYKDIKSDNYSLLLLPALIFLFGLPLEKKFSDKGKAIISIHTELLLPYSPEQVYDAIKSVDTLDVEPSFLMKIDLPIPQKCVLEKEAVGALRTCHFEGGKIVERVTEMEPGKILRMDVIDYELTGRDWLGFEEAIYTFEEMENGSCKLTRITTYTSELKPRFYWAPLEAIGIQQEHDFVFRNLVKDLNSN